MPFYKKISPNLLFLFFLTIWFLINLIQSACTEVINDEAYYYLWGKYLDWGYFDHPPMVGLLTWISQLFFNGNLGVRFATVLLQLGTLWFVWKILDDKQPSFSKVCLFFIIAASLPMFVMYGFITTPDAPLLFFTALFLYIYKLYIEKETGLRAFFLALSMAGLMYSKYQAALLIILVFISDWRTLFKKKTILAIGMALVLYLPHILWQFQHDFPSFKYHLVQRSRPFQWKFFLEFLPIQWIVFNPVTVIVLIIVMIKRKIQSVFEKALYFVIIGMLSFFWITSFRGHVEPHWTVLCSIPILILLYKGAVESTKIKRWTYIYILPSLFLLFSIRVAISTQLLPPKLGFTGKKEKMLHIQQVTQDLPVLFLDAFQKPSMFWFFTGKEAVSINADHIRKTQFDIWQFEKKMQGKEVFLLMHKPGRSAYYNVSGTEFDGFITQNLQTTNRLEITFNLSQTTFHAGDTIEIPVSIFNPYDMDIDLDHNEFPVSICGFLLNKDHYIVQKRGMLSQAVQIIPFGQSKKSIFKFPIPLKGVSPGEYKLSIGFSTFFGNTVNSSSVRVHVIQ